MTRREHAACRRTFPCGRGFFRLIHCPFDDIVDRFNSDLIVEIHLTVPFEDISIELFPLGCLLSIGVYPISSLVW